MANKINLVDATRQSFSVNVENRILNVSIYYSQNILGFLMNLDYGDFSLNGARLVNSLNLLNKFRNILPFGIQIYGPGDPFFQSDFADGSNVFLILTKEEKESIQL
jgi:hypothetical protein